MSNIKNVRPSWDNYFLKIMDVVGERSTCDRGKASCVIVKNKRILVTGYAGAPEGLPHCDEVGHQIKKLIHEDGSQTEHCMRTVHAEVNAVCQAARIGVAIDGATVYTRMTPCRNCTMVIINCGIKKVFCDRRYHAAAESEEMLKKAGVPIEYKYNEIQEYPGQK